VLPAGNRRFSRAALFGFGAAGALSATLALTDCVPLGAPVYGGPAPDPGAGGAGGTGGEGGAGGSGGEGGG
jgi:hypothetical protein